MCCWASKEKAPYVEGSVPLRPVTISLTVTCKGQVTLRKELLAHLGIQPGQRLEVEVLPDGRLELHAARATGEIDAMFGLLAGRTDRRASLEEIAEAATAGSRAGRSGRAG